MKRFFLFAALFALMMSTVGCATVGPPTRQHYESAAWVGAIGAGAGALIDDDNRWRGALIGGALGSLAGYGITEIRDRAAQEAAMRRDTVSYYNRGSDEWVEAEPIRYGQGYAEIRTRTGHGRTVTDEDYQRVPLS